MDCSTRIIIMERNLNVICFFVGGVAVLWFGYKFIKNKDIQTESIQPKYKTYYRIGKLYFLFVILMFFTFTAYGLHSCFTTNTTASSLLMNIARTLYGIQHEILLFLLIYRLQLAFDDTAWQLTQCNICFFRTVYVLYLIAMIAANIFVFTGHIYTPIGALSIGVIWITQFVLIVWITVIFIYKLRTISFEPHSPHNSRSVLGEQVIFITTKIALLTIVALVPNSIGPAIRIYAGTVEESPEIFFLNLLAVVFDVSSNFVAILLGFQQYEAQYLECCGCCHRKCVVCCTGARELHGGDRVEPPMQQKQAEQTDGNTGTITDTYLTLNTRSKTSTNTEMSDVCSTRGLCFDGLKTNIFNVQNAVNVQYKVIICTFFRCFFKWPFVTCLLF
eukprot:1031106_1